MEDMDPELQAMAATSKALALLEDESARARVLKWLLEKYNVSVSLPKNVTPHREEAEVDDDIDETPEPKGPKTVKKASKNSGGKKRSPRKVAPLDSLKNVNISTTAEGYPSFHAVKAKTDKLLWVLMFAKTQKLESLTNQEISQLSDRLGDGIPGNNINKNYQSNLRKGFVNRSIADGKIRLTPDGDKHLKALGTKPKNV